MEKISEILERITPTTNGHAVTAVLAVKYPQRRMLKDLDANWHPKVAQAVEMARSWQQRRREQAAAGLPKNASMVLLATAVPGDLNRTGYGCGKTHIATAALWSECLMLDDEPVAPVGKFFMAEQIIANLDGDTPAGAEIGDAPILVVDDVGAEGVIPFVSTVRQEQERHSRYFKLVDYCYKRGVSLVVTGNLTISELAAHIGGRAWSRLLQMAASGFILDMTGVPDYRRRAGGR